MSETPSAETPINPNEAANANGPATEASGLDPVQAQLAEVQERDARDMGRADAPLRAIGFTSGLPKTLELGPKALPIPSTMASPASPTKVKSARELRASASTTGFR